MPLIDIVSAALSGPAGRVLEGSVRAIVAEVLQDRGYASPAEILTLRDELQALAEGNRRLEAELSELRGRVDELERRPEASPVVPVAGNAPAPAPAPAPVREPVAEAERLGMSLDEHQRWRAGGLPGRIGPDGYLELEGKAWRVDPGLEGRPYSLSQHERPRVMVDGKVVKKEPAGGPA